MLILMSWGFCGDFFVLSFKGCVWKLVDLNGDGIEDEVIVYGDEFVVLFGLYVYEIGVDVI